MIKEKEYYREKITDMIKRIDRTDVLNYIYIVISDIMKERENKTNELS